MFDELTKQMQGTVIRTRIKVQNCMYKFEGFKANENEMLQQTYNRYCSLLNDMRKNGFKKDNLKINVKFLKNLNPAWKTYTTNIILTNVIVQGYPM